MIRFRGRGEKRNTVGSPRLGRKKGMEEPPRELAASFSRAVEGEGRRRENRLRGGALREEIKVLSLFPACRLIVLSIRLIER